MFYRVIKQLLKFLISEVNAQLLEAVQFEDLEAGNIENTDEAGALALGSVKWSVNPGHDPFEQSLVGRLGDGLHGELNLLLGLGLGHVVTTHFDPGL